MGGALVVDETNIARTPAEMRAANSAPSADDSSRGELEGQTEIAREKLWQHAWAAVRSCVCFDRQGSELPLHICQHLKDLYCGGLDGEFRYSQNVKSLLDMVVVLARPRIGVSLSDSGNGAAAAAAASQSSEGASGAEAVRALQVNAKMNKIAETQLVRGVIALLRSIAPVDIAAFSALVTAISELAFGRSFLEMSFDVKHFSSAGQAGGAPTQTRCFVLGPVDPKLRTEVGEYLMAVLEAKSKPAPAAPSSGDDGAGSGLPLVFYDLPPSWLATCLEIVVRYFVGELCVRPSMLRCSHGTAASGRVNSSPASKAESPSKGAPADRSGLLVAARSNSVSGSSIGNFFTSIGRLIATLEDDDEEEDEDNEEGAGAGTAAATTSDAAAESDFRDKIVGGGGGGNSAAAAARGGGGAAGASDVLCVHSLKPLRSLDGALGAPADASPPWCPFIATSTDLKLLRVLFAGGLRCAFVTSSGAAPSKKTAGGAAIHLTHKQQCMWSHILTILLCVSSPWKQAELSATAQRPAPAAAADGAAAPQQRPASLPLGSGDESLTRVPSARGISANSSLSTPVSPTPAVHSADSAAALGSVADGVAFAGVLTSVIDVVIEFCIEFRYLLFFFLLRFVPSSQSLTVRDRLPSTMALQVVEVISNCSRIAVVAIRKLVLADERARQLNAGATPTSSSSSPPASASDPTGASLQIFSAIVDRIATHLGNLSSSGRFQIAILKRYRENAVLFTFF